MPAAGARAVPLRIQLTRRPDGAVILRCLRADGTATWQRHERARAAFFPLHDLTHYAVETELGMGDAFYGLVAQGWGLEDFGAPWPRGPLPSEAAAAERIVGMLDVERASGERPDAAELNRQLRAHAESQGGGRAPAGGAPRDLTDEELGRIRARRAALFARWGAVAAGETLELVFDRA